ncbi:YhcH/YjgK/YiaL family protein [Veillonella montpellierensis]|uniref:YhcH/YjgK/YiaL family protein n=1 Tax=Veillonella montpellierensis TaxID=187328 RepID=UPI0023F984EE|nr:YhcH/YjgK/YiaL family protein [Veillonella montpellierensis]
MIFQSIAIDYRQFGYAPAIVRALDFLKHTDLKSLEGGRHNLEGEKGSLMYANVDDVDTLLWEHSKPEAHHTYIDIQYMVTGEEEIGYIGAKPTIEPIQAYPERDLYFYDPQLVDEARVHLQEGCYAIFYPADWHRPLIAVHNRPIPIRKVVVKVHVDLI